MSNFSPFAAFRTKDHEINKLAEEHLQHDLRQSDRDALKSAAQKLSTHATVGSILGLGLGFLMAFRVRSARTAMFNTFRAQQKPTHVQFADGRTEALPDLTPLIRPTTFGDIATYFFFGAGGLFVGGETGLLTGSWAAKRTVESDPESTKRIETAYRRFRADVLRKEADKLDGGATGIVDESEKALDKIW